MVGVGGEAFVTVIVDVVVGVVKFVELVEVEVPTVKLTGELFTPYTAASIMVVPADIPVARPAEDILAILGLELVQVTCELMSVVEPSG